MGADRALATLNAFGESGIPEVTRVLDAWRSAKLVLHFEDDLADALWRSDVVESVPIEVLRRMSGFCCYIATPGRSVGSHALHGFFAMAREEFLDFLLVKDEGTLPVSIMATGPMPPPICLPFIEPLVSLTMFVGRMIVSDWSFPASEFPSEKRVEYYAKIPRKGRWKASEDGSDLEWVGSRR